MLKKEIIGTTLFIIGALLFFIGLLGIKGYDSTMPESDSNKKSNDPLKAGLTYGGLSGIFIGAVVAGY